MGIDQEVKIIRQIEDSMEQTLTVRTFYHFFVINENRISGENSILKPGSQTFTKNIPVPTITSLIYLAKGLNYIAPADTPKTPSKIIKLKRATAQNIVDGSVNVIREREATGIQDDDPRSAAEIQTEINEMLEQISAAEDSLKQTTDRDQKVTKKLIEISTAIAESTILKNRYDALRTQYESDMRRLTFIAEADLHRGGIPKLDHCPFCNGELPKEKTQSCLDAAIAEADKIEIRIKDLKYADEALTNELSRLQNQKESLLREQQQVQAAIRGELRPQVEALRTSSWCLPQHCRRQGLRRCSTRSNCTSSILFLALRLSATQQFNIKNFVGVFVPINDSKKHVAHYISNKLVVTDLNKTHLPQEEFSSTYRGVLHTRYTAQTAHL